MTEADAPTWQELRGEAEAALRRAGVHDAALDARRIAAQAAGLSATELLLVGDERPNALMLAHHDAMLARRLQGEPLQYVLGSWSFRTLDLHVDARVLIPRPETEVVVEHALGCLRSMARPEDRPMRAVDLGTGSGAIGLSLLVEADGVDVWMTDASADALAVAGANLAGLGRAGVRGRVVEGDWFGALPDELAGTLDLVVSNPPYVADRAVLPPEVSDHEPAVALRAGPDGTDALSRIIGGATDWLAPTGALVLELDPAQATAMAERAVVAGFGDIEVHPDLTGRARVLVART